VGSQSLSPVAASAAVQNIAVAMASAEKNFMWVHPELKDLNNQQIRQLYDSI
jgi:hypothetical protein